MNKMISVMQFDCRRLLCALTLVSVGLTVFPAAAEENPLQTYHQQRLDQARAEVAVKVDSDKVWALQREAAELDSLNKPGEALDVINRALQLVAPDRSHDLIATKAGILFHLNDPQDALDVLTPQLTEMRRLETTQPGMLGIYTEGYVTATFSHIQLEQWREAIETLVDAQAPLEGPSFYAYRSVVYRYIMGRANDPALANPKLEQDAAYYAKNDKSHYGALLRLWQGEDTHKEIDSLIGQMSGQEKQEAMSEALFYCAAHDRFVKGDAGSARAKLDRLNNLAPYGSIEWIYGKRVLQ